MPKRLLYGTLLLLIIISVLAVAWWQRPARVVTGALQKLGQAQTQKFTANLSIAGAQAEQSLIGSEAQVELILDGAFERKADQKDSIASDIKLITTTEGLTLNLEGQARFIDDSAYVRITKSPPAFPILVQLKDMWLVLPRGGSEAASRAATPESEIFTSVERVNDHYQAQATPEAVVNLLDAIADILGTRLTTEQVANLRENVADLDTVPVEIWVTPLRHELIKLTTTLNISDGNAITFTFEPRERNQPTNISVPDGAVTLEEALGNQ